MRCLFKPIFGDFMPDNPVENDIEIKNISKSFGNFDALKDVSLSVKQGERIVVCGPSGSGKSTLIRCINGLETHEDGSITVDGILLNHKTNSLEQIRSRVGMVFQQFNLFPHLTVLENITLGPIRSKKVPHEQANIRAMGYLERVKIPEQAEYADDQQTPDRRRFVRKTQQQEKQSGPDKIELLFDRKRPCMQERFGKN